MADLYALDQPYGPTAGRTWISVSEPPEIANLSDLEISPLVDILQMVVLFVGAHGQINHLDYLLVGKQPYPDADRSQITAWYAGGIIDFLVVGRPYLGDAEIVLELDFFELAVTAQQHSHRLIIGQVAYDPPVLETYDLDDGTR